jgi:hypothetical protein
MGSVDGEVDGIHAGEPAADPDAFGLLNSGPGARYLGWGEAFLVILGDCAGKWSAMGSRLILSTCLLYVELNFS